MSDDKYIYTVGKINIGEILYRIEDSYNTIYRVNNIYTHGVDLIKDTVNGGGRSKYVDYNTLIEEYIRIKPHGYIEFTVMQLQDQETELLYDDLRVSAIGKHRETGELHLVSTGLLLTPVYDIYSEYTNMGLTGSDVEDDHSFLHGGTVESTKYSVAIAFYFGDTIWKILSFLDDVFEYTLRNLTTTFKKHDIYELYDDNLIYIAEALDSGKIIDSRAFTKYIGETLGFKGLIPTILGFHDVVFDEYGSDCTLADDGMFLDSTILDYLTDMYNFPNYPYFATEYKLHIDLNNIANPYKLVCFEDVGSNFELYKVFVVMTLCGDERLNKYI